MTAAWRLVLVLALVAMIGPAVAALAIVGGMAAIGCDSGGGACGVEAGPALAFALDWAWRRILDPLTLSAYTATAATAAAFGFAPRRIAVMWSFLGACWGAIAALILPFVAVMWAAPRGCRITEAGASGCVVWGHPMGDAFALAGVAFWYSLIIVPISLGGVLLTFLLATLRQRWMRPA